jgi:hypothetical protein
MRLVLAGAGLLVALFAATFVVAGTGDTVSAKEGDTVTVTMGPGRDGSQTGTATLTDMGSQTQVVLDIQPGPAGVGQPVHIHAGSCPGVAAVAFSLTNIVDGKSTTVVDATLASLQTGGFSINAHQDTTQAGLAVYVSCGNIPAAAQATPSPAGTVGGVQTTPTAAASPAAAPASGGGPVSDGGTSGWWYLLLGVGGALILLSGGVLAFKARSIR